MAPWFWEDWKDAGRVLVSRRDFLDDRIDLKTLLLDTMPLELRHLMQRTLRENVRQHQYSTYDDQNDGIRVALDGLHNEALEMQVSGLCGYREEGVHKSHSTAWMRMVFVWMMLLVTLSAGVCVETTLAF